jgi:hypothetical protein
MPTYFDLEMLPVAVKHTKLPPLCTFKEDVYKFKPITHFGLFEVSGYISDSLNQQTYFKFKVDVVNTKPFLNSPLSNITLFQG